MYLHLILNHLPGVFLLIGIFIFFFSYFLKNKILSITACSLILFASIIYFPAFYTGEEAEHHIEQNVQQLTNAHNNIEAHEELAEGIYWLIILLGCSALVNITFIYRNIKNSKYISAITLVLSIVVFIMLWNVAHSGAMIRRPELINFSSLRIPLTVWAEFLHN
ncbi:MAG: hypothetical protein H7Y00_10415 [Fimbriimonadaceae bacterium]|nr:hypothetical protein [Chitinophagales bacterium]